MILLSFDCNDSLLNTILTPQHTVLKVDSLRPGGLQG